MLKSVSKSVVPFLVALAWAGSAPALAQIPAQTPPPAPTADIPDWQRPNVAVADYAAGAKRELDALAAQLAERKQRANERGATDVFRQLEAVEERLRVVREKWDKLPQANQANWDTVRKDFEMAYEDLMQAWRKAPRAL